LTSILKAVAFGSLQYTAAGHVFKGLALCFQKDNRGVFYAIASKKPTWSQNEPVMKEILNRFFYSGETGLESGGPSARSFPQMVPWTDPKENAFTCPVPQGWNVEGE
jgi:hypothetical protein